jgi:RTX calcium-binding nonapeptide repeat (4 copies)
MWSIRNRAASSDDHTLWPGVLEDVAAVIQGSRMGISRRAIISVSVACFMGATGLSAAGVAADADQAAPLKRIIGTNKANVLRGTAKSDFIDGRAGNDFLDGLAGDDRLIGGPGADSIFCGRGRDTVSADRRDTVARDCEVVRGGPPSPLPSVVPEQLVGLWNRNVTDETALFRGAWSLSFDRAGFVVFYEPVGARVPGVRSTVTTTFSATADGQLVIRTTVTCLTTGTYHWEIADASLQIKMVSDDCPRRAAVMSGDWTR